MNNFKTILSAVFLVIFILAVLIFSGAIKLDFLKKPPVGPGNLKGKVVIWGIFDSLEVNQVFENISQVNRDLSINYVKKQKGTYQQDLIKAFASGKGPDLFFITADMIIENNNFIYKIPYEEKTFRDLFIDGAEIYLDGETILGFPLAVDPMVMYYNKDIFSNEGLATMPQYWEELFDLNSKLTKKENSGIINQSMIALGQYGNVNNAKDILSTLLIQNGNTIVNKTTTGYTSSLKNSSSPSEQVFKFFVEFSNLSNTAYSWNRSLPNSFDMFIGGKLAIYLGFASELFKIQSANPNLSFDVKEIPQAKGFNNKRTFGKIYTLVVNNRTENLTSAFGVANSLSEDNNARSFATAISLPPASRVLLSDEANKPKNPYLFTFFKSAIISRSWPDPGSVETDEIFNQLIENILSNKLNVSGAMSEAQEQINIAINEKLYE